jgi:hypothetical protein
MRFLTLYTPADPDKPAPSPESMAKIEAFVEASIKSSVLVTTGGVAPSHATGMRMKLTNGKFDVVAAPSASDATQPAAWSILNVNSPEHLQQVARQFLEMAGDGAVEVMEITQMPTA